MQAFPLVLFPVLGDAIQRLLKFGTFFKSLALRISSLRDPTSSTCSLWCYIQLRFLALVGFSTSWIFPFYCDSIVADKVATEVNVKIVNLLFNSIRHCQFLNWVKVRRKIMAPHEMSGLTEELVGKRLH